MASDHLELVACINEENKRRKRRRIILTEMYFESCVLAMAYLSTQRGPRDLGHFSDDERKHSVRKYLLKEMYDSTEVACYDQLRLTKRNFHDLCAMLREKCGLRDSVYVSVEEKVAMFLLVVGHGLKMRLLRGTYKRSLETISRHFSDVLTAILSPSTYQELYNLRHSRARNVVERTFGLLKKKWAILRTQTFFDIEDQVW
jgi:hypothetical protein